MCVFGVTLPVRCDLQTNTYRMMHSRWVGARRRTEYGMASWVWRHVARTKHQQRTPSRRWHSMHHIYIVYITIQRRRRCRRAVCFMPRNQRRLHSLRSATCVCVLTHLLQKASRTDKHHRTKVSIHTRVVVLLYQSKIPCTEWYVHGNRSLQVLHMHNAPECRYQEMHIHLYALYITSCAPLDSPECMCGWWWGARAAE